MRKRAFLLVIPAFVLVFGLMVVGCDDGSDNDNGQTINGWTWNGYTTHGTGTVNVTPGSGNDRNKVFFSGNVELIEGENWGVVGLEAVPNSQNLAALKAADAFSFKCKGDGRFYIVRVATSDILDYQYHEYIFHASETEQTILISYNSLRQPYWIDANQRVAFNKDNITHIDFQAHSGQAGTGEFELTIWDLKADSSDGIGFLGETLNLSGQVWIEDWSEWDWGKDYILPFTENGTVTNVGFCNDDRYINIGGSGSVTNGQLSFSVGTPSDLVDIQDFYYWWGNSLNNFNVSSLNTRIAYFSNLDLDVSIVGYYYSRLHKAHEAHGFTETVTYIYVDRDVTITGSGKITIYAGSPPPPSPFDPDTIPFTTNDPDTIGNINVSLKKGWNAITIRREWREDTVTIFTGEPSLARWMFVSGD